MRTSLFVFQFLIGRLETLPPPGVIHVAEVFQFLIGRLETSCDRAASAIRQGFNSS